MVTVAPRGEGGMKGWITGSFSLRVHFVVTLEVEWISGGNGGGKGGGVAREGEEGLREVGVASIAGVADANSGRRGSWCCSLNLLHLWHRFR